ncbi:MAG: energy-coupling factor ABC transporter ATP-binding protein [Clostridiales Family XIII bacterium]|nr:energy-coupling factor ABC transporter ATP-binding protein [Clostridiales Family XIII bacterium]
MIRDFNLEIPSGKLMCIVGGNGAGKSTVLKLLCGLLRPQRGKIAVKALNSGIFPAGSGRLAHVFGMLPQNPQLLFSRTTVSQDLADVFSSPGPSFSGIGGPGGPSSGPGGPGGPGGGAAIGQYLPGAARSRRVPAGVRQIRIDSVATLLEIDGLLARNPYDLSGGELQRAALAKLLLADPDILLLDEPTMGMDNHFKEKFSVMLRALIDKGKTVVMVSHDVEFCAKHADLCALLFDGSIAAVNEPGAFFSGNGYYTTAASRMSRHIFENAVTAKEVIALCRENLLI